MPTRTTNQGEPIKSDFHREDCILTLADWIRGLSPYEEAPQKVSMWMQSKSVTGQTFESASKIAQALYNCENLSPLPCTNNSYCSRDMRAACAVSLQKVSEIIVNSWTYSVAFDVENKTDKHY